MAEPLSGDAVVLFRELATTDGMRLGIAQLNAEKSLNSLTLEMVRLLDPKLRQWAADPGIACVVLQGAGTKAFCAGGDVRFLHQSIVEHAQQPAPNPKAQAFFSEEYRLDHRIHNYPKPILVWGGGIVMGGGLGLMVGASHRVVTETSRIAMPEITIGLYPDVGGSWFLRRMPGRSGLFLALTGAALNAGDALAVGLADHCVPSSSQAAVMERLSSAPWTALPAENKGLLSAILHDFAIEPPPSNVRLHAALIEQLAAGDTAAAVVAGITGYQGEEPWLKKAATALAAGSPTSAALIWELWQRARHMSLADVFRVELVVSLQCCEHPDFAEGVRALLLDRDNRPRWTPATLAEVSPDWVAQHFAAPWSAIANEVHPLNDL